VTGDRHDRIPNRGVGYDYLHVVVDDNSRLAYVELHPREDADTNARTLERALRWFGELGLSPPEAVMTDNALVYTRSRRFGATLAGVGARHLTTPHYTPRWNGKAERFIQTLQNEWAYAHRWRNSSQRARALSSFVRYYNRRRPHSSLGDRPPAFTTSVGRTTSARRAGVGEARLSTSLFSAAGGILDRRLTAGVLCA
jgi:transposase InsO family protein